MNHGWVGACRWGGNAVADGGFFLGGEGLGGGGWRRTIQATMKISVYQHEGEEQGLTESCLELLFTTSSEGDYCPN